MGMKTRVDSQCAAFQAAISVLSRPWTALILTELQSGAKRFSQLAERGPGEKILSARLKDLESQGIVARSVEAGPPVRVSYALTACGREFSHVAAAIEKWGRTLAT
jgi:DNA-binding HxlR family transcriptional regulator